MDELGLLDPTMSLIALIMIAGTLSSMQMFEHDNGFHFKGDPVHIGLSDLMGELRIFMKRTARRKFGRAKVALALSGPTESLVWLLLCRLSSYRNLNFGSSFSIFRSGARIE